jgi:glyoxylase-like metal-dependent hydrolase (beta-lactamase superfamily II)
VEVVPGLHYVERIWDTKVYLLVEGQRVVVIDAAMPGRERAIWRHLDELGYPPQAVEEIWLTHGDVDHMGSVAALRAASGAKVVAHRDDVPLVEGRANRPLGLGRLSDAGERLFNWVVRRIYQPIRVNNPVVDGDRLGDWLVVHVPGHTAGSVCFYHPGRKIAVVGDAINYKGGRLGAPPRLFSDDLGQARRSIQKLAALDFEACCFGHGPPLVHGAARQVRAFANSLT